jgi:hypothetical protein
MLPIGRGVGWSNVSRRICVHYLNLIVNSMNQKLVQSRRSALIGVNPIVTKNNTIVTLHLDDEEHGSERFVPHDKLHRDDASSLHWVDPHAIQHQVGLHELVVLPSKLVEHGVWHQIDDGTTIDEHPGDRTPVDVASNVQWLHVLARLLGHLKMASLGPRHI